MRKSRAVGLGRVPEAGKDAGKGRKAFRRHVEEPAHGAYFPLPRAGRGWKALARGGRGGPQAPRFAAQGRKGSSGNCACGACASRGRQAVRRRVRAKGSGGNRAGARAASVSRRRERRGRNPQEGQAAGAGRRVCRCWAGHARWGGRRKARGSLHACAMPRRFGGGMTPGRCSAGSSCRCAVADHAGGNGRCGALCRPEGAALSSPGPAGGERGNALPGFPCPGTFLAPRPFQRWREQRGGRAGEGEDAAHRADETRAEGMRWQAAGPHIAWLEEPCRWRKAGRRVPQGGGARKACSAWPICPKSFLFPAGGNGAGEGREPGRVARRAVPLAQGRAASAAAGRGKGVPHGPSIRNPSFSMPEGTARGKAGSRAGVARRAVPLRTRRGGECRRAAGARKASE